MPKFVLTKKYVDVITIEVEAESAQKAEDLDAEGAYDELWSEADPDTDEYLDVEEVGDSSTLH